MDTISAIATATGAGGIGIIRMSGDNCFEILKRIFIPFNSKLKIEDVKGYSIKYGYIINSDTEEKIDEVLVSFFRAPKSYTTENMCEINSHGGIVIERKILEECLKNGARLAEPGEFTKRAFLGGRIDLSQAESVIDIINAKTENEAKASVSQLQGALSTQINDIRSILLDILSDIEASIDYPEYDIEQTTNQKAMNTLNDIENKLEKLGSSYDNGKLLKEGVKTAIIGKPNAGKSSLLNLILNEDRAIVSEHAGTTRDTIEEFVNIEGIPLKIIDTAGIRDTNDIIEKIGVKKAVDLINDSDLIIALFDNSKQLNAEDFRIIKMIENKKSIILLNKCDLSHHNNETMNYMSKLNKPLIMASMKTKKGLNELYKTISNMFNNNEIKLNDGVIITNLRHKTQINNASESVKKAKESIKQQMPIDVISICIKEVLEELGEITGENVTEDIINSIFAKFCLGK